MMIRKLAGLLMMTGLIVFISCNSENKVKKSNSLLADNTLKDSSIVIRKAGTISDTIIVLDYKTKKEKHRIILNPTPCNAIAKPQPKSSQLKPGGDTIIILDPRTLEKTIKIIE